MSPSRPAPPPPPPPPPRKRKSRDRPRDERMKAARVEIGKAMRGLRSLRGLFIVDAVLLGILFAASLTSDFGLFQVLSGVMFVTAAAGAVLVVYQPWIWGLVLAIGHTLLALLAPSIITIGIAVLLWFAVKIAADTRRLLRLYPDAWQGRNTTYSGRDAAEVGSKWRDRAREDRRKRTQKVLLFVVLPAVLLVVGMIVFSQRSGSGNGSRQAYTPPPVVEPSEPLEPTAEAFRTVWNASDFDGAMAQVLPAERDRIRRLVRKVIRRRKWDGAFPTASAAKLEEHSASQYYAWHDLEGYGTLRVSWEWSDGRWWVVRVKFKKGS